jgi:hypothetical protein
MDLEAERLLRAVRLHAMNSKYHLAVSGELDGVA